MRGEAADVIPVGVDPEEAMERIAEICNDLPIGQVIVYGSGSGFIHISIDIGREPRRQMLRSAAPSGSGGPYVPWVPR